MTSKRKKRVLAAFLVMVIAVVGLYIWYRRSFCYSPWRLRYEIAGAIQDIDLNYISWCRVPLGSTESKVRLLHANPVLAADAGSPKLADYVHIMCDKAHYSRPPDRPGTRVLVYEGGSGSDMIIVYYYFRNGRLEEAFITRYQ